MLYGAFEESTLFLGANADDGNIPFDAGIDVSWLKKKATIDASGVHCCACTFQESSQIRGMFANGLRWEMCQ